jgi:plasmid stability protein
VTDFRLVGLPPKLHDILKERAKQHGQSVSQEILQILETLRAPRAVPKFKAFRISVPLSDSFVRRARREGRR